MSIAKFDLYKPEWLELVFDDRNKSYGAYDLRKHYSGNLLKAMGITFFSVALLITGYTVIHPKPKPAERMIDVPIIPMVDNHVKPPVVTPPKTQTTQPQQQAHTIKYPVMVPTIDKDAQDPPKIKDLETAAISTQTSKGKDGVDNIDVPDLGTGTSAATAVTEDNTPKEINMIEVLPTPYGGADAWAKFLQKNIRYPRQASEANIQGRVFLSFIVEKDGKLSNITVERGVGYGLDDEALRVLKLAPAWKPGIQNGHPVRVKYNIPINFVIPDQE